MIGLGGQSTTHINPETVRSQSNRAKIGDSTCHHRCDVTSQALTLDPTVFVAVSAFAPSPACAKSSSAPAHVKYKQHTKGQKHRIMGFGVGGRAR
jgi:hypothetical protein